MCEWQEIAWFAAWMDNIQGYMEGLYMDKRQTLAQRKRNRRVQNKWWWWWSLTYRYNPGCRCNWSFSRSDLLVHTTIVPKMEKNAKLWKKAIWIGQLVAYLGFRKRGAKFLLATSAHTKEGANKFSNFFSMSKKNYFGQRGAMAQWPP